ncbi:unnamed protein product, partial [Ectocarpus sp. 12 AP-2014]
FRPPNKNPVARRYISPEPEREAGGLTTFTLSNSLSASSFTSRSSLPAKNFPRNVPPRASSPVPSPAIPPHSSLPPTACLRDEDTDVSAAVPPLLDPPTSEDT